MPRSLILMAIEVTSLPDRARPISIRRILEAFSSLARPEILNSQRMILRSLCGLLAIGLVIGADSLLRSYKYYSRLVDARLASGYLTSRPVLYAAPRTIERGQKLTKRDLIQ